MSLFIPAEFLDILINATGFNLDRCEYNYKFTWLLERIGMMKMQSDTANIVHDNPKIADLVAVIKNERVWYKGAQQTISGYQVEMEVMRNKISRLTDEVTRLKRTLEQE